MVLETYARRFFGDEDPVGRVLRLQDDDFNDEHCQVTGVFRDVPQNSHLKLNVLFSHSALYHRGDWARERYELTWERRERCTRANTAFGYGRHWWCFSSRQRLCWW